ncbi:VOC family protein [Pseudomonas frederiksbergensis]|uniref:VOC family protein n=1 Tax=Pseudomonas frederiksbergensis TaxID=104087 RepID=UPI003D1B9B88
MKLDHATIVTEDLEGARRFLCSIVGLSEGPRPPFGVSGDWLYANGQPVIHLIEAAAASSVKPVSPRIDHIGLRLNSLQEWSQSLDRIRLSGVHYWLNEVPLAGECQLFVAMASGVVIERVTDQQSVIP